MATVNNKAALYKRFDVYEDARGSLLPLSLDQLEMKPKRIFIVTGAYPGAIRGGHGPKQGSQLIVLVSGEVAVLIRRSRGGTEAARLGTPGEAVRLSSGDVAWQRYRDGQSRLVVIADTDFDPDGYAMPSAPLSDADIELLENI